MCVYAYVFFTHDLKLHIFVFYRNKKYIHTYTLCVYTYVYFTHDLKLSSELTFKNFYPTKKQSGSSKGPVQSTLPIPLLC